MPDLATSPKPGFIEGPKELTGATPEPERAPPPAYDAPPPVDKLMAGIRDGITLAVACGIAATVLSVALATRACQSAKLLCRMAGRKSREWGNKAANISRKSLQTLRQKFATLRSRRHALSSPLETPPAITSENTGPQPIAEKHVSPRKEAKS